MSDYTFIYIDKNIFILVTINFISNKGETRQTISTPPRDESHGLQGGVDWKSCSLA